MESTQGLRWDVVLAASVAMAATAGLFLGLTVLMRPEIAAPPSSHAEFQLVWIVPASTPARMRTGAATPEPPAPPRARNRTPGPRRPTRT